MMRRRILIALFGLGTVLGFGSGIHSLRHGACSRHDAWERHVAHVCADAALHPERVGPDGADREHVMTEQAPAADEPRGW